MTSIGGNQETVGQQLMISNSLVIIQRGDTFNKRREEVGFSTLMRYTSYFFIIVENDAVDVVFGEII
jgi:hypothetical protein